jgi:transposase
MDSASCQGCRERDLRIAQLEEHSARLERRVAKLEAKLARVLGRNAKNSSIPPSANPPGAPSPVRKEPTGRKPGGQPGHTAQTRTRLPKELVTKTRDLVPAACEKCQQLLSEERGPNDPDPVWHQVVELPQVLVEVTEYLGHARTCGCCGHVTWAVIPAAVRAHAFGPRFTAVVSVLTGMFHNSKRDAETIVQTVFGTPIALGTVTASEQETSAALAAPYEEAAEAAQQAPVNNVDETGWKQGKRKCWLWTAVSALCTFFVIHPKRSAAALNTLFKRAFQGIVISDRWSVYSRFRAHRRQLCWAHLIRDFQALYETRGPGTEIGGELLCFADDIFNFWYRVRDGTMQRSTFRQYVNEQRPWLRDLLGQGAACGCAKTAGLCRELLKWEPALWTFARVKGVEPTNNAAERALRKAVLWRKRSFGCKSDAGCRFAERMLTIVKTLQQHNRPVLAYLVDAIKAHRKGRQAPPLLPA